MLINFSNHPYRDWDDDQKNAAAGYGNVTDMQFPVVVPEGDEEYICSLADEYMTALMHIIDNTDEPAYVHIMGEMTFTHVMANRLKDSGIKCIASTSDRIVTDNPDGSKNVTFRFVRFRMYP